MDSDQPTWGEGEETMGDAGTHAVVWTDDKDMVYDLCGGDRIEGTLTQPLEESGHQCRAARGSGGLG